MNNYNISYSGKVIFKMFNESKQEMDEFHQNYKEARIHHVGKYAAVPTAEETKIARDWLSMGTARTAQKYGMKQNAVNYIVNRVSRHQFKYGG